MTLDVHEQPDSFANRFKRFIRNSTGAEEGYGKLQAE